MNANETLKIYFGYDTFRDGQEDIINAILSGRDVLAIMPTGAGKSICYQVPALMMSGITIVISPLISLMQDQVKALNEAGVHAAYINSSLTENQINKALSLAAQGRYKIIYVAPERLTSYTFLDFACHVEISMVTVDEAHCISQWGQDFRPSYLKIVEFVARLPRRPIVSAFTATATEDVKEDIIHILKLEQPKVVVTGFDRENLYYSVERIRRKDDFVLDYIHNHPQESGIIYCATRKNVDKLFELLFKSGVAVTRYHAGLDNETRKKNQEDFIYDRAPIVVATNAFGMGIDKSNVRYVIHYNMPQSMENYYQEAGRAGRDGEAAQCILLFSEQDMVINRFLLEQKDFSEMDIEDARLVMERDVWRLQVMERYCKTSECLRNYILSYFGEQPKHPCGHCGNCQKDYQEIDMTGEATWVLRSVEEAQGRYGIAIIAGVLMGANRARLKELGMTEYASYGALKNLSEARIRELINLMITEGYLYQTKAQYSVLRIGDIGPLLNDDAQIILKVDRQETEPEKKSRSAKAMRKKVAGELTSQGSELFELLRKLRTEIASEEGVPPYIIFSDKTLIDMCVKLPENEEQFLDVSGVGAHKLEKYGDRFLRVIREFKEGL